MSFSYFFSRLRRSCMLVGGLLILSYAVFKHASAQSPAVNKLAQLPVLTLTAGMHLIKAEVATDEAAQEQGLMFRDKLGPNEGMLFVFNRIERHCFWMKNTKIPLAIAFIDVHGMVTDIDEMQADTRNLHCPSQAGLYALEMESGWFAAKGIKPGVFIKGLPH